MSKVMAIRNDIAIVVLTVIDVSDQYGQLGIETDMDPMSSKLTFMLSVLQGLFQRS